MLSLNCKHKTAFILYKCNQMATSKWLINGNIPFDRVDNFYCFTSHFVCGISCEYTFISVAYDFICRLHRSRADFFSYDSYNAQLGIILLCFFSLFVFFFALVYRFIFQILLLKTLRECLSLRKYAHIHTNTLSELSRKWYSDQFFFVILSIFFILLLLWFSRCRTARNCCKNIE